MGLTTGAVTGRRGWRTAVGALALLLGAVLLPGMPAGAREPVPAGGPERAAAGGWAGGHVAARPAGTPEAGSAGAAHRDARERALAAFTSLRQRTVTPASSREVAAATGAYGDPAGDVVQVDVMLGADGVPSESAPVPAERPDADLVGYTATADTRELAFTAQLAAPPGATAITTVSWGITPAGASGPQAVTGVATLAVLFGQPVAFFVGLQGPRVVLCQGEASVSGTQVAAARFPTSCAAVDGPLATFAETAVIDVPVGDVAETDGVTTFVDRAPDAPARDAVVTNGPLAVDAAGPRTPVRLADEDRVGTAVEVSAYRYPVGAPVVYVARADAAPDALSAGTLDAGPTLLVPSCDELPMTVREEIERVAPVQVVALGGPLAVCDDVLAAATAAAGPLARGARIGGATRIDTAALVAETTAVGLPPGTGAVLLASADDFPDALAGGTLGTGASGIGVADGSGDVVAAPSVGPILLVPSAGPLPDVVARTVAALAPGAVTALGGPLAVPDATLDQAVAVAQEAVDAAPAPVPGAAPPAGVVRARLAGPTRYDTAAAIAQAAFPVGAVEVHLATGEAFPDALAGGKLARGPILLVPSCGELPGPVAAELDRLDPSVVTVLGGGDAVCDATLEATAGSLPVAGPGATPAACRGALPAAAVQGRDVRCAFVAVPLDRSETATATAETATATIDLHTAVVPAPAPDAVGDPIVLLGGGPGEKTIPNLLAGVVGGGGAPAARSLDPTRDLVLVEQRGIGPSRPALDCPEVDAVGFTLPADASTDDAFAAIQQAAAVCYGRLTAEGIDLPAFDTLANAADLEDVAAGLGYPQVNLYGTSYGAKLAHQATRGDPGYLRSVVLSSPVGAEDNFIADVGPSYAQALDRVFAACEADPACGVPAADLRADLDTIVAAPPLPVPITLPGTGEQVEVSIDAATLSSLVFTAFYSAPTVPLVPAVIDSVAARDPSLLAALLGGAPTGAASRSISSYGMQQTVLCAEETAYADPAQVAATDATLPAFVLAGIATNPVLGGTRTPTCDAWQVEPADPLVLQPFTTTVPTLAVTGSFDQITPPQWGQDIASTQPNAFLVEATDQGHAPLLQLEPACGDAILRTFLADPGTAPDGSCAARPLAFPDVGGGPAAALAVPADGALPVPRPGDLPHRR